MSSNDATVVSLHPVAHDSLGDAIAARDAMEAAGELTAPDSAEPEVHFPDPTKAKHRRFMEWCSDGRTEFHPELVANEIKGNLMNMVLAAVEAGKRLCWAKEHVPVFEDWLTENISLGRAQAYRYMRLAKAFHGREKALRIAQRGPIKKALLLAKLMEDPAAVEHIESTGHLPEIDDEEWDGYTVGQARERLKQLEESRVETEGVNARLAEENKRLREAVGDKAANALDAQQADATIEELCADLRSAIDALVTGKVHTLQRVLREAPCTPRAKAVAKAFLFYWSSIAEYQSGVMLKEAGLLDIPMTDLEMAHDEALRFAGPKGLSTKITHLSINSTAGDEPLPFVVDED